MKMIRLEKISDLIDGRHFRSFYQAGMESFSLNKEMHKNNIRNQFLALENFCNELGIKITIRVSHTSILSLSLFSNDLHPIARHKIRAAFESEADHKQVGKIIKLANIGRKNQTMLFELSRLRLVRMSDGIEGLTRLGLHEDAKIIKEFTELLPKGVDVVFDPGIYRSLNYYSGIIIQGEFFISDDKKDKEVLGGGEYNGMVESFMQTGILPKVYSFGFACGVERILNLLNK